MAAVSLPNAFGYKWAENGTVDAMDDSQYKLGWSFIGATPPSVEQFNKVLQTLDEKANYINSRRVGSFQSTYPIGSGVTLTVADVGKAITLNTGGSINLPLGSTVLQGAEFMIGSTAAGRTIGVQGSDSISMLGTNVTSVTLDAGDTLMLVWNGTQWVAFTGSAQMRYSSKFRAQLAIDGWQYLPSGLIVQWVRLTTLGGQGAVSIFPIAFPNACFLVVPTVTNGGSPRAMSVGSYTQTGFAAWADQLPTGFGFVALGF